MSGRVFSLKEKGVNCPERWQGPWRESSERGITVTLTKAFLNCNELPKSELCLLSSGIESPRLEERKPTPSPSVLSSYKGPREPRVYVHACIHARRSSTPRHEYIYIDRRPRRFFICPRVGRSIHRGYFIYIDGTSPTCPESARYTFRREHEPRGWANDLSELKLKEEETLTLSTLWFLKVFNLFNL